MYFGVYKMLYMNAFAEYEIPTGVPNVWAEFGVKPSGVPAHYCNNLSYVWGYPSTLTRNESAFMRVYADYCNPRTGCDCEPFDPMQHFLYSGGSQISLRT